MVRPNYAVIVKLWRSLSYRCYQEGQQRKDNLFNNLTINIIAL